jgi:dolichol-phosphate hexosyltransferase
VSTGAVLSLVLLAILLPLALNEAGALAPWLAERLLSWTAARLGTPDARERYGEEWLANLDHVPGQLTKLLWALGLLFFSAPRLRWQAARRKRAAGSAMALPVPSWSSSADGGMKVSILMCALNEQRTIGQAIQGILAAIYPCEIELIVVDDGSSDATASIVAQFTDPRLILHRHERNKGRGAALRTAASLATGTHLLPFDADMEYAPADIADMLVPVIKGRCDVVYGVRLFGCNTVYQTYRSFIANKMLTHLANLLFNSYLNDMQTCLKLMPLSTFNHLALSENGFGVDTEITATLLRLGVRPFDVPVSYYGRTYTQGQKVNWRDAIECLRILFRVRAKRKSRLLRAGARG